MLLPLWVVYKVPAPAFAAANGQWIAIRKRTYQKIEGHRILKSRVVEDVEMARLLKAHGFKIITASGKGAVFCRMYHSFREIWLGLNKNFYGLTGKNIITLLFFIILMIMAFIVPYGLLWWYPQHLLTFLTFAINLSSTSIGTKSCSGK